MQFQLKKWEKDDYQAFFAASADEALYANMSDGFPKTMEECKEIVQFFTDSNDETVCSRAVVINDQIAGCIAAFFETGLYHKNAEIAYWLNKEYRGMGIMPDVIKEFTNRLFADFQLHRVWARPFEHNKASRRALEKAGFQLEGLLKEDVYKVNVYYSSAVYALVKEEI